MRNTDKEKKVRILLDLEFFLCFFAVLVDDELKEMLQMTPMGKKIDLESKLSLREKQRAKRKAQKEREEAFEAKTGKRRPL